MAACGGSARGGRRRLLASCSVAALLVGGAMPAWACQVFQNGGTVGSVTNSLSKDCILVFGGATVTGNVTNTSSGVLTSSGTTGGIHIENAKVGGTVSNAGTITNSSGFGIVVAERGIVSGISNSGTITGAIDVALSGVNNFGTTSAGGGIVNSGTISGGIGIFNAVTVSGGITNSGSGTISVSGAGGNAIQMFQGISVFVGNISNAGMITASSGNGISLAQIATFAGAVSNSGTISAGSASAGIVVGTAVQFGTTSPGGGVTNSGRIVAGVGINIGVSRTGAVATISTFAGGITNSGAIVANTGIVVTSGVSIFLGAIANSGTIAGTGGTAIDISAAPAGMTINILGGAISGNILGAGTGNGDTINFTLGAGNTFTYNNAFTGFSQVNINSGTVVLNGANTASFVDVLNGATLAGTGSIAASGTTLTIHSGGTFAPGPIGGIGTMSITGSLVFQSAATYLISVNGAGAAGKAAVTGTATLGGASVQIASGSTITIGTKYTILTDTAGGLGGTNIFNPSVVFGADRGNLSYDAHDVFITFEPSSVAALLPPGAPLNVVNVTNAIDNFLAGGNTPPAGFNNLFSLPAVQLQAALTRLTGEVGTGAQTSAFTLMTEFMEIVLGDTGGGGGGGGLPFAPSQQAELPPDIALAYGAILKAPPKPTFDQRWSAWGSGFGGTSITDGNAATGSNTVTATTYGSAAGMDYRLDPNTRLGFALAGSGTSWGLAQGLGTGRGDSFQAAVYGKTYLGPVYLAGVAAFGNTWFTTNRTATFGDQLTANFTGQSYGLRGEAGYRYAVPMANALIGVTPYGAVQTQWFRTPAYSETDLTGGGFALANNANTANDTRSELGARFDTLTTFNNAPLILRARLAWAHDWTSGTGLSAVFQSLPGSGFVVNGAAVPRDSALTTASAQHFFTPALSFTARFDGEFAPTSQTYAGTGTLRYTW